MSTVEWATGGPDLGTDLPGARAAVRLGAWCEAVVYALLVPSHLVVLDGDARWVMAVTAAVTAVVTALTAIAAGRVTDDRRLRPLLVVVGVAPLVNSILHIAVTRELQQTVLVMLVVVAIGAVAVNRAQAVGLIAAGCVAWALVVVLRDARPSDQLVDHAFQLALACVLAGAVFSIRSHVIGRLLAAQQVLAEQGRDLAELRSQAVSDLDRLRALFEGSPLGLSLSDEDRRFIEVNPALCRLVGVPAADLLGRTSEAVVHPDEHAQIQGAVAALGDRPDGVAELESRYVRPDGETVWVWLTLTRVRGPEGQTWTLAHVQDVTERKRAEQRLQRSLEALEGARDVAHAVERGEDPRPVVLASAVKVAEASSAHFFEPRDRDRLAVTASYGDRDLRGTEVLLADPSMTAQVWRTGQVAIVEDARSDPRMNVHLVERSNASSVMWAPALVDDEVVAVVSIVWPQRRPVSDLERAAVQTLVAEAGLAIMSERMRKVLERSSRTDPLTGLLNRRGWDATVGRVLADRRRSGDDLAVALLDFDHFKAFNDEHGHLAGDEALRSFGEALSATRRAQDVVARWGGEEFAVLLPGSDAEGARTALERLRRCVPPGLTCSAGYTLVVGGESLEDAMQRADDALYAAKDAGRDRVRYAAPVAAVVGARSAQPS